MSFDKDALVDPPSKWFSSNVEYQGRGRATFDSPQGIIEGFAKIRFDEFGESSIEMEIDDLKTEQTLRFGLMQFFCGDETDETENGCSMSIGTPRNRCVELTVETTQGTFSTNDQITYGFECNVFDNSIGSKLNFSALRPQFDTVGTGEAKYWVLPLSNFISGFAQYPLCLDRHPLRICSTSISFNELPNQKKAIARFLAKNKLIIFKFNDSLGFIEPLADYNERKNRLLSGQERNVITSVMVGEVSSNSIELEDLDQWFPFDFLTLLELTTGTEVGAPWIEFRDTGGNLVRRIHIKLGHPVFSKGRAPIREEIHHGTGYLLTKAQSSPEYGKSYLRVAIKNLVRGGLCSLTIDERFRCLFLSLDNLCQEHKVKKTLSLSEERKCMVKSILKEARKAINKITKQAQDEGDSPETKILKRISQKISEAETIESNFGENVIALIGKFGFPDPDIVSKHYDIFPRSDKRKWSGVIPYYRGVVMHKSYFDFLSGKHDIEDLWRIMNHLHDILVRIILKTLDYDGQYQPTVINMTDSKPVDWVKPDFSARRLGY